MFEDLGSAGRLSAVLLPRQRQPLPAGLRPPDDGLRMELAVLQSAAPGP